MTRISKYRIKEEVLFKTYQLFFEVVSRSSYTKKDFLEMLDDIFSPTEKIMIAKRIAIIYLIIKGLDQRSICFVLKVSSATTSKFMYIFNKKDSKVVRNIERMIQNKRMHNFLEDLLHDLTTQPGLKIGHWQKQWDHLKGKSR